jgi:hypothetical protein
MQNTHHDASHDDTSELQLAARELYDALIAEAAERLGSRVARAWQSGMEARPPADGLRALVNAPYYPSPVKHAAARLLHILEPETYPESGGEDGVPILL